ncbi:unnamed protein product [marine sediment metagenome]|uniref:Uncharacterized protein n=1 Tax=marine sediment metagenome TaxID=412755 RepID=X1QP61_9ZZZZ
MNLNPFKSLPPAEVILSEMTREKAIEILGELNRNTDNALSPDQLIAITMATCALIADELNLER